MGHKRILRAIRLMSALPLKADIDRDGAMSVSEADIGLFDRDAILTVH
jgi:hypothetical protein